MTTATAYTTAIQEFQAHWLPHVSDSGLQRLIELLATKSPLLIHGAFTKALPMGCLASHIAWHHPSTQDQCEEAGICWLTRVAGLNPATSKLILLWDEFGLTDPGLVAALLKACQNEREARITRLCEQLTFDATETCSC